MFSVDEVPRCASDIRHRSVPDSRQHLGSLSTDALFYYDHALSPNTISIYRTAVRSFILFCHHAFFSPFPLSEHTLIQYVCMLARSLSYATIKTYLAGIEFYSIRSGFCRVIPFMQRLFYVLRGIRRYKAAQSNRPPKKPITVVLLVSLFRFTSLSYSPHDAAMLHVAMSFAFSVCFASRNTL